MRRIVSTLALSLAAFSLHTPASAQATPADDSIYQAFGQKAGIQALMEDFFTRLQADPRTRPFFEGASRERLVQQLTDQLCQESGGPCTYAGAPMGARHAGMHIGKDEFNALVEVLQAAMDAKGIPFRTQNGLLARLAPMHREIITRR